MKPSSLFVHALILVALPNWLLAADPPKSPAEQQELFHLPPGFEIQLVVSEPDIGQPMNLSFDARGRLWITSSVEYPYPANSNGVEPRPDPFAGIGQHAPRDWVTVVEGFEKNGQGKEVSRFATGLNIPIGQTPVGSGDQAIVYSIPNIDRFTDADGDGIAEKRAKLFGPVGNIDTHGMANSFTPWIDGWIYGCHGFSNTSEIVDDQGSVTRLTSGNTYRFRADGSEFEAFTFGQVNPFGMTFDPLGNLYNADCHSKPVYQLIRGAKYPHFGYKPDALGFGPTMINHNHGSTGICGPAYYAANHFPREYRDNLFICNPVSQVIHRDKLERFGSTYQVDTQPDIVRCDDTWFRPVDVVMGPDGALYIADFYNPIIGHYESPLDHPDRDRTHGRVWRVIYTGEDASSHPLAEPMDLTSLKPKALAEQLDNSNLLVRTLATNLLVQEHSQVAVPAIDLSGDKASARQLAHSLWVLERTRGLSEEDLASLAGHPNRLVRVHLIKAIAERSAWSTVEFQVVRETLKDQDAFVVRASVEALGRHPDAANVRPILHAWNQVTPEDTHLVHTIRFALREHFRQSSIVAKLASQKWSEKELLQLTTVAKVAESEPAALWLIQRSDTKQIDWDVLQSVARQAAIQSDTNLLERIIELARDSPPAKQLSVLISFSRAEQEAGRRPSENSLARTWAKQIWSELSEEVGRPPTWTFHSLPGRDDPKLINPWEPHDRQKSSNNAAKFLDSIVHGEQRTGILRSRSFPLPEQIQFWMCGQDGLPDKESARKNFVRVRLTADNRVIAQQHVPRNDVANHYSILLGSHVGKSGYVEIVDGNDASSYAWIAVQGFSPEVPPLPLRDVGFSKADLLQVVRDYQIVSAQDRLATLIDETELEWNTRLSIAETLEELGYRQSISDQLMTWLDDSSLYFADRQRIIRLLGRHKTTKVLDTLAKHLEYSTSREQLEIALVLGATQEGTDLLLEAIAQGKASPYVLQNLRWQQQAASTINSAELKDRIAKLTSDLPSVSEQEKAVVKKILVNYALSQPSFEDGAKSFEKRCAACHRLGAHGSLVGPQLDGIGKRPLERIVEDIVVPSRNVDAAFKTVLIQTIDGQIVSGLPRREEGEVLVIANEEGKEVRISRDQIEFRKESRLSLMPANFGEQIPQGEFMSLIHFLTAQEEHRTE